ncbi:MAG: hypothetical protein AB1405_03205 [Bdellovibrionota bacterium]
MARIRTVKPEFFTSESVGSLSPLARLAFAGLWCHADRRGRLEDKPRTLKTRILPYDECDFGELLQELVRTECIFRYEIGGRRFIQVVNFEKHQVVNPRENESYIPAPPGSGPLPACGHPLPGGEGHKGRVRDASNPDLHACSRVMDGKEGNGREKYPPTPLKGGEGRTPAKPEETKAPQSAEESPEDRIATNPRNTGAAGFSPAFLSFWEKYPRKAGRNQAWFAWKRLENPEEALPRIESALAWQAKLPEWNREGGRFIPNPANYLDGKRFEDEPPDAPAEAVVYPPLPEELKTLSTTIAPPPLGEGGTTKAQSAKSNDPGEGPLPACGHPLPRGEGHRRNPPEHPHG